MSDILRVARRRNATHHVTGLLVFDGDNFFQYLEGQIQNVSTAIASIQRDIRHRNMCMISQGEHLKSRCFPTWSMGYALTTDENFVSEIAKYQGLALASELLRRVPELDMEP